MRENGRAGDRQKRDQKTVFDEILAVFIRQQLPKASQFMIPLADQNPTRFAEASRSAEVSAKPTDSRPGIPSTRSSGSGRDSVQFVMGSDAATIGEAPIDLARPPSPSRRWAWLGLFAILAGAALIRIRLLDLPLERDEGEYAYAGQLMLQGVPPYKLAWNMKLPGTYAAYAAIMAVLGQSTRAIHFGLLAVNALTTVLLFFLAKRWFDVRAALAASGTFALLSLGEGVLGMAAHATHFVILFAVAATLLMFRAIDSGASDSGASDRGAGRAVFLSGVLYGFAVLMKQQGVLIALFGGVWLLWSLARSRVGLAFAARRLAAFALGAFLPLACTCLALWKLGVFDRFWFWTFQYAREYASEVSLEEGRELLFYTLPDIVLPNAALWLTAAAGLILVWWKGDRLRNALPLTLFFVFSFVAVCPGLYFRGHYFVLMLPAVALLTGAAVNWATVALRGSAAFWLWAAAAGSSLFLQSDFLFRLSPVEACRREYGLNPFPEAIGVSQYLRSHTKPGSRIAVLGSEPEIYFYADRPSATGYIYTYGLMEPQPFAERMQEEMIGELEAARPEYVVLVPVSTSWLARPESSKKIFDWWRQYSRDYTQKGVAGVADDDETEYLWGADAAKATPVRPALVVYQRNADGRIQ